MSRFAAVILAAGKGTRMKSHIPKVTHAVGGRPMLEHVLRAASETVSRANGAAADPANDAEDHSPRYVVVVGHERERVENAVTWTPPDGEIVYITQEPQLGTGDAVRHALAAWQNEPLPQTILVLYGDTPLVRAETLSRLIREHDARGATLTFLTGHTGRDTDYGRVLRDGAGRITGIVERKHATPEEVAIPEVNSGIYCFESDWLRSRLGRLDSHENGEYYLTDLIAVAVTEDQPIATASASLEETLGVNDRVQLAEAEAVMRRRVLEDLMRSGVTVEDPATTYVQPNVRVGADTILRPGTRVTGATIIGERCDIGPNSVVRDSTIGDDCAVLASWVEEATMCDGSFIGPMSHLRPGARLETGARLGNYAEVKNATIGRDVQMHHFSYVGDATIGADSNVGAGVITMNYDGSEKHHTEVGERVFLGSDTLLRAPITVGEGASTGAGAVVTRDVPPGALVAGVPARVIRRVRSQRADEAVEADAARHPTEPTAETKQRSTQPAGTLPDMREGEGGRDSGG